MKKVFLFLFMLTLSIQSNAQTDEEQKSFLESWEGNYQGDLEIYGVTGVKMKLLMELHILEKNDSTYNWTLVYKMKDRPTDTRAYEVKIIDIEKGHYQIDEKNSIVIDAFLHNNIFTSFFKVMDSFIVATYSKLDDETLQFEIISATDKKKTITGNTTIDGEKIPDVITSFVNGRQKAILKKIK